MPIRAALIVAALLGLALAGCDAFRAPDVDPGPSGGSIVLNGNVPQAVRERAPLPSCGVENANTQNGPWNVPARRCFAAAYQAGMPAEFVSTRLTTEGDPIRTIFRTLGPGQVEVIIDSSRDAFSNRAWTYARCPAFLVTDSATFGPDFGWDEGCASETIG